MTWSPFRQVLDLRPVVAATVYAADAYPTDRRTSDDDVFREHRVAVLWDEDNDERVLDALAHIRYCAPRTFSRVSAIAESKGSLTVWAARTNDADWAAIRSAADGDHIHDAWPVQIRGLEFVPTHAVNPTTRLHLADAFYEPSADNPRRVILPPVDSRDALLNVLYDLCGLGWWASRAGVEEK